MKSIFQTNHFNNIEVLDIGCGTGFYIDLWKSELGAKRVAGIDITKIAVDNLKRKYYGEEFFLVDISSDDVLRMLGNKSGNEKKYDRISAFDNTIMHKHKK